MSDDIDEVKLLYASIMGKEPSCIWHPEVGYRRAHPLDKPGAMVKPHPLDCPYCIVVENLSRVYYVWDDPK